MEYEQKNQQQEIRDLQSSVWDTNTFQYKNTQIHYQLWDLNGEVHLLPNGGLQAQEAKIYSWTNTAVFFDEDKGKTAHSSFLESTKESKEEHLSQTIKSKSQHKRKITPTWWIVVLIVLIGIVVWRKRR